MKPCMHILEISISSQNRVIVRPTKTPKSADKKCQFLTFKVNFLCQKLSESFYFFFIEEYQFKSTYIVIGIFWKLQFLKPFISKMKHIFCQLILEFWWVWRWHDLVKKCLFPIYAYVVSCAQQSKNLERHLLLSN